MTAARTGDSTRPTPRSHKQPIDAVTAADSMVALLSELKTDKFPREERLVVNRLQASALALRLNWVSELCRTIANDKVELRGEVAASAGATQTWLARLKNGPGKWLKWARASVVAGKARLGLL
jgi:hypothetical protein